MRKVTILFVLFCIFVQGSSQTPGKPSLYLGTQVNQTLYDRTEGNNPWSGGLGIRAFLNNRTNLKPLIDFTADYYLADDKVYRQNAAGMGLEDVDKMLNLFAGLSWHPAQHTYLFFLAGPSVINGKTFFGIKPGLGFYMSNRQRWTGSIAYINIFNRDTETKQDFGSICFSIGMKLF